jgi:hypothetical protein
MFSKEGPVFWWNLWLMKVDVFIFCLSLQEMTTSLLDGIFVREEWKRSPRWIRQIADEYSLGKSWRDS